MLKTKMIVYTLSNREADYWREQSIKWESNFKRSMGLVMALGLVIMGFTIFLLGK